MSNVIVGDTYNQIIDRLIRAAKKDFQEEGYPDETLEDLRLEIQKRLSEMAIAQLPWEPEPAPPTYIPSNNLYPRGVVKPDPGQSSSAAAESNYEPHIKQEMLYGQNYTTAASYSTSSAMNPMAGQRAASLLQQQFGNQANASLRAAGLPQQSRPMGSPAQASTPSDPQRVESSSAAATPSANSPAASIVSNQLSYTRTTSTQQAQVDGGLDSARGSSRNAKEQWADMMRQVRSTSPTLSSLEEPEELAPSALDILAQLGGSVVPATPRRKSKGKSLGRSQMDGNDDDDRHNAPDSEEDAINSDLDDSDDEAEEESDETRRYEEDTMLCLYDRVLRVKSRWRANFISGVLNTNNKDYLFNKANGEYEW